jgi:hypothetical protein
MSTYDASGETRQRKTHDVYLPIAVAIMLAACFAIIFGLNPEAGGYGGGNGGSLVFYESAALMAAAVLVGYVALIFRAT